MCFPQESVQVCQRGKVTWLSLLRASGVKLNDWVSPQRLLYKFREQRIHSGSGRLISRKAKTKIKQIFGRLVTIVPPQQVVESLLPEPNEQPGA